MSKSDEIADLCEQAGCDEKQKKLHHLQYVRKAWNPHPPQEFVKWWVPHGTDPESRASVGGHSDAWRVWARKDPGKWEHRKYGIDVARAYNTACYFDEFETWQSVGSPEPEQDFISLAASLERQKQYWKDARPLMHLLLQGAKPEEIQPLVEELNEKYPGYERGNGQPF